MASEYTSHYNLDKYVGSDKPNLRDQYNAAMDKIDTELWSQHSDVADAKTAALNAANGVTQINGKLGDGFTSTNTVTQQMATKANSSDVASDIASAVSGLASETYVDNAVSGLASETYVNNAVSTETTAIINSTKLLRGRKIVCVGDSLTKFGSISKCWPEYLAEFSGAVTYNYAVAATGFTTGGTTIPQQINNAASASQIVNADITDVIIMGGFNDFAASYSTMQSGVIAAITNAKNNFENARIHIGAMLHGTSPLNRAIGNAGANQPRSPLIQVMRNVCARYGCIWINEPWTWMVGRTEYNYGDGIHTTTDGQAVIAGFVMSHLCGGSTSRFANEIVPLSSSAPTGYSDGECNVCAVDGTVFVNGCFNKDNVNAGSGTLFTLPAWAYHGEQGAISTSSNPSCLVATELSSNLAIGRVYISPNGNVNIQYMTGMAAIADRLFFNLAYPFGI